MPTRRGLHGLLLAATVASSLTGCATTPVALPTATPTTAPTASLRPVFADRGEQEYASGTARLVNGAYQYVVATGDTTIGIATRFGTIQDKVNAASLHGSEIFQGDVLRITR